MLICISYYISAREFVSYNDFNNSNMIRYTFHNSCQASTLATMLKSQLQIREGNDDIVVYKLINPIARCMRIINSEGFQNNWI